MDLQGIDSEQSKIDGLLNIINKHLKFVPGFAIGIIKKNKMYVCTAGVMSNTEDKKIEADTFFSISSVTKILTCILVMRLMENGLIDIEKQVCEYLPDFQFRNTEWGREITIGHLLSHTSGLDSVFPCFYKKCDESLENHVFNTVNKIVHVSAPEVLFNYSSANFNLLGYICERVTNQAFEDLISYYVAAPLEINEVQFAGKKLYENKNVATGHIYKNRKLEQVPRVEYNRPFHPSTQAFMNISDLSKIAQMLLNDGRVGNKEYLRPSSVALMKRQVAQIFTTSGDYFGYGLCLKDNGEKQIIHEGNGLGFYSKLLLVPNRKIGITMLSNSTMHGLSSKIMHYVIDNFGDNSAGREVFACDASQLDMKCEEYRFYNCYYAADASDVMISMYYEDSQMYLDYSDISRNAYTKRIPVKCDNARYSIVMGAALKKIAIINAEGSNMAENIIIGAVCFCPLSDTSNTHVKLEKYCGNYVGQFETSTKEENVRLYLSKNSEIVLNREDGTEYILHMHHDSTYFCSAFGIIEFEEKGNLVSAFKIKYMQRFERKEENDSIVHGLHHIGIVVENIEDAMQQYKFLIRKESISTEIQVVDSQRVKALLIDTGMGFIELIEPIDESSAVYSFMQKGGGLHHLCYEVENIEDALDYYKNYARVIVKPTVGLNKKKICFIYLKKTSLGIRLIELIEKDDSR